MKKIILLNIAIALALSLVSPSTESADFTLDTSSTAPITGLWWNANESGWGVTLTQQFDIIFVTIFTFDANGLPIWYVASNCVVISDGCSGELYRVSGGTPITSDWDGSGKNVDTVGSISFTFIDNHTGTMDFTIDGVDGSKAITRQVWSTLSPGASMTALWWNQFESGWGVTLTQQTDIAFATMFTFDVNGFPTWYVASNCIVSGNGCTGTLYEVTGGSALTQSWNSEALIIREVGSITFTFSDPDNGSMDFTINDVAGNRIVSRQIWSLGEGDGQDPNDWVAGQFEPELIFKALCESPRTGIDPSNGLPYPDGQGTTIDENNWLRSWSNDLYLWYQEIVDLDPAGFPTPIYFDLQKTFDTTPSGNLKDKFHFSYDTGFWQSLSQSGVTAGYGATFAIIQSSPPRQIVVAYTEPGSPATSAPANLARGARLLQIDGVDVEFGNDVVTLNAGLFPSEPGESHDFTVEDLGSSTTRAFTMVSDDVTSTPVQNVKTLDTISGAVGYMLFNDHIATSEQQLIDGVSQLRAANITDLVLDIRYNGGGFLAIASELAFMIAGLGATAGQIFEDMQFNDKHTVFNPVTGALLNPWPFFNTTSGFFSASAGQILPSLNLTRVYVLTGPGTCSASESVINSLRGVDVEVIQIGSTTCGKPYGFYPQDNCGTTYFSIQLKGVNEKGFGDYTDGFSPANTSPVEGTQIPGCSVADDFTHALGDPEEGRLAAALAYRVDQSCPSPSGIASRSMSRFANDLSAVDGMVHKSPWLQNRILRK